MEKCKCCDRTGIQVRNDGVKVKCPACGGTGNWFTELPPLPAIPAPVPIPIPVVPYYLPPVLPYYHPQPFDPYIVTCRTVPR